LPQVTPAVTPLRVLGVAAGFLVVGVLALLALRPDILSLHFGPYAGTCARDGQIDAAERDDAASAALDFANAMAGPAPLKAYAQMPEESRGGGEQNFLRVAQLVQASGPFAPLRVDHTYMLDFTVRPSGPTRFPCTGPDGRPNFVVAGPARTQAHVAIRVASAKRPTMQWTFSVWLAKQGAGWSVLGFNFSPSMLAGHTGEELWGEAQLQRRRGHDLNAALLYATASELLARGPYFQSSDHPAFDNDVASFKAPAELTQMHTRPWRMDGQDFPVTAVRVYGVDDHQLVLAINQPSTTQLSDQAAEQRDHRLIDAFTKTHPEWRESFDAVAARVFTPDNTRSFGVVYDRDKGYLPIKPGKRATAS
jgi:hypothetical protein